MLLQDYVFGIEGLDSDGNMFQRFHKSISHVIKERSTKRQGNVDIVFTKTEIICFVYKYDTS